MVVKYDTVESSFGRVIPVHKGTWQIGKQYNLLDVVSDLEHYSTKQYYVNECVRYDDTNIYRCIVKNSRTTPSNSNYWEQVSNFKNTDILLRNADYICVSAYEAGISRNLFNKDNPNIINAWFDSTHPVTSGSNYRLFYIQCESNTPYIIHRKCNFRNRVGFSTVEPTYGTDIIYYSQQYTVYKDNRVSMKIVTAPSVKYLLNYYYNGTNSTSEPDPPEDYLDDMLVIKDCDLNDSTYWYKITDTSSSSLSASLDLTGTLSWTLTSV